MTYMTYHMMQPLAHMASCKGPLPSHLRLPPEGHRLKKRAPGNKGQMSEGKDPTGLDWSALFPPGPILNNTLIKMLPWKGGKSINPGLIFPGS